MLSAIEARDFDCVIMDLNYTRDTTSGQEGLDLLDADSGARQIAAGDCDDGVGQRGTGGGGDAPGRARFHPEAVGKRAAGQHRPHADRAAATRCDEGMRLEAENRLLRAEGAAHADRGGAVDAAGAAVDLARGPVGCQHPDHGRAGHRQRSGRQDAARGLGRRREADGDGERRAASRKAFSRANCSAM